MSKSFGIYIHIPFCNSKCPYCDFFSGKGNENQYNKYMDKLLELIEYHSKRINRTVTSVYFGGGTPSVMGEERLSKILNRIKTLFKLSDNAEITLEVNPDTGKDFNFLLLKESGFNRVSIGLQSAVKSELDILGRIHDAEDAKRTVVQAQKGGINNISLDLMIGIPLQNKESLKYSIDFCSSCNVTHISSYILKVEPNTRFYQIKDSLNIPDDDEQAELYMYAVEYLESLGYRQYEISNFAQKGFEGRHNIGYWSCDEYLGIGPSAHSFFDGKRFFYKRDMEGFYENKICFDCTGGDEAEYIMLAMRLKRGLQFDEFEKRFKKPFPAERLKKIKAYSDLGYIELDNRHFNFTPKGFLVSNTILSEII